MHVRSEYDVSVPHHSAVLEHLRCGPRAVSWPRRYEMRSRLALMVLAVLVPTSAQAQRVPDWKAVEAEAISTIQSYVRINTSNPPGDVRKAADFLVAILEREGMPVKRYESAPARRSSSPGSRAHGTGEAAPPPSSHGRRPDRSLALGARSVRRRDRGRSDLGPRRDRHERPGRRPADGVSFAEAAATCRSTRDVILMAVPDEEVGGTLGAKWMLQGPLRRARSRVHPGRGRIRQPRPLRAGQARVRHLGRGEEDPVAEAARRRGVAATDRSRTIRIRTIG